MLVWHVQRPQVMLHAESPLLALQLGIFGCNMVLHQLAAGLQPDTLYKLRIVIARAWL